VCPAPVMRRYLGRLSGPLLDRIDLHLRVEPPAKSAMLADEGFVLSTVTLVALDGQAQVQLGGR